MTTSEQMKSNCDTMITGIVAELHTAGAPIEMILDRILTFAAAQACTIDGSPKTAKNFRIIANKIEGGLFHKVTGEGQRH
ncbi:hypothetical protein [Tardiphaga sp. vice278]|uniref:hypothetical protein n=1 Tax=Tardiphaga sp. vice278 TaxID=2592815 RepID=UPI0011642F63|nr:hypothetical protein [Tardiphaga sp. vice278]QDM19226.1 hypothetical protein FNL53_27320 [Tardiphaga sp. vice278]